jgi:hypothetical protein
MPFSNPILAGQVLARAAMQSQDYVPGVSGWAIYRDGSAEFNNIVARGEVIVSGINNSYIRIENSVVAPTEIEFYPGDNNASPITTNGYIKASNTVFGSNGYAQVEIATPGFNGPGGGAGFMTLTSEYGGPTAPSNIGAMLELHGDHVFTDGGNPFLLRVNGDIEADSTISVFGSDIGKGNWAFVAATTSSAGITTETVVLTLPSTTYYAGRAYRVAMAGGATTNTANTFADFRVKKTSATGATLAEFYRTSTPAVSLAFNAHGERIFVVGAADVTAVIVLTLQTPTGQQVHFATTTSPRYLCIDEVGPASYYPNTAVLS